MLFNGGVPHKKTMSCPLQGYLSVRHTITVRLGPDNLTLIFLVGYAEGPVVIILLQTMDLLFATQKTLLNDNCNSFLQHVPAYQPGRLILETFSLTSVYICYV